MRSLCLLLLMIFSGLSLLNYPSEAETKRPERYFLFQHRGVKGSAGQWIGSTSEKRVIETISSQLALPVDQRALHINGLLAAGSGGYNVGWSWHFVPGKWDLVRLSAEICDGTPQMVEEAAQDWVTKRKRFCPWQSYVVEELLPTKVLAVHSKRRVEALNCEKECADATPQCLPALYANAERLAQLLRLSQEMRRDQPFTLTRVRLGEIFDMQSDPMLGLRKDTEVRDNRLSNSGVPSIINVEAGDQRLFLHIPSLLAGGMKISGDKLTVQFSEEQWAGSLEFCSRVLNQAYGGPIRELIATPDRLIATTANGCAEMPLKPVANTTELVHRMKLIARSLPHSKSPKRVWKLLTLGDPKEKPCVELTQGYGQACNTCPIYEFECTTASGTSCIQVTGIGPGKKEDARQRAEIYTGGSCAGLKYFRTDADACVQ